MDTTTAVLILWIIAAEVRAARLHALLRLSVDALRTRDAAMADVRATVAEMRLQRVSLAVDRLVGLLRASVPRLRTWALDDPDLDAIPGAIDKLKRELTNGPD